MKKKEINILDLIYEFLLITGNPILVNIFERYKDNEEELYSSIKNYLRGIYEDINDNKDNEEIEGEKTNILYRYVYLNGMVIDASNISRIELDFEYNPKKNKNNYFIKIVKKYPSPLEEEYIIPFNSEEDRDKGYDVLKAKLKLCNIYIV